MSDPFIYIDNQETWCRLSKFVLVMTFTNVTLHKYRRTSLTENAHVTNKIHFPIPALDLLQKFIQLEFVSCILSNEGGLTNH